jgi:hypothetical protein
MGICIEYPSHENVDLQKLYLFDVTVRSINNLNKKNPSILALKKLGHYRDYQNFSRKKKLTHNFH